MKNELINFLDTFNFIGKEFEIHSQITLMQIFKWYEEKENNFKFLYNKKCKNIFENIGDMEFDFLMIDVDSELLKLVLNHLAKNFLLLNIKNNKYEINQKTTKLNQILSIFDNSKTKFDILGEIGLNVLNDDDKLGQF